MILGIFFRNFVGIGINFQPVHHSTSEACAIHCIGGTPPCFAKLKMSVVWIYVVCRHSCPLSAFIHSLPLGSRAQPWRDPGLNPGPAGKLIALPGSRADFREGEGKRKGKEKVGGNGIKGRREEMFAAILLLCCFCAPCVWLLFAISSRKTTRRSWEDDGRTHGSVSYDTYHRILLLFLKIIISYLLSVMLWVVTAVKESIKMTTMKLWDVKVNVKIRC